MSMLDFNDPPPAPADSPLAVALACAERGWPVFPCNPLTKGPLVPRDKDESGREIPNTGGLKKATLDTFQIRKWWMQFPNAMVGVPTGSRSGFWVLDIDTDPAKGKDGIGSLASIGRDLSELMDTAVSRTGSGGYHCLFKHQEGITNARGSLPPYLDVRGEGGYIIAAGSRLSDGRAYAWLNPPDEIEIADAPDWLLEAISSHTAPPKDAFDFNEAPRSGREVDDMVRGIVSGQTYHDNLVSLAAKFVGSNMHPGAVVSTLRGLMESVPEQKRDDRWIERFRDIPRTVSTAVEKWGYQPRTEEPEPQREGRGLRLLSIAELAAIQPPKWLIDGVLPEQAFCGLYGAPGAAKSFVAVDMALSIATGRPWQGRPTQQGSVVYIMGEGQAGAARRIFGWLHAKGADATGIPFGLVPRGVAMPTGELDELIALIGDSKPALIVLDTLARTFGQGDENSQKDMNAYVAAVDRLREATGSAVLVIHHSGKDEAKGSRGSTAFPGAVDTNIFVKRTGQAITLINKAPFGKQKDAEEFDDIALVSTRVEFEHRGENASTLVLTKDDSPPETERPQRPATASGGNQKAVLEALRKAKGEPLGLMRITTMVGKDSGTVAGVLSALTEKGLVLQVGEEGSKRWTVA